MMNPDQLRTKFIDYLTPAGWERTRYAHAVGDLNKQLTPFASDLKDVGQDWEPIVHHRSFREGIGQAVVRLKARMRDGVLEMSLDHRSESYDLDGDVVKQRTTVLKLRNGTIESIQTGKDYCSSLNYKGNNHYIQPFSIEWEVFSPKVEVVDATPDKTKVLQKMANSLRAAAFSPDADVSTVY